MVQAPTGAQAQYMAVHIRDDRKPALIISDVICLVAAIVAVAMRFICRRLAGAEFKADDWWILVGLVY